MRCAALLNIILTGGASSGLVHLPLLHGALTLVVIVHQVVVVSVLHVVAHPLHPVEVVATTLLVRMTVETVTTIDAIVTVLEARTIGTAR